MDNVNPPTTRYCTFLSSWIAMSSTNAKFLHFRHCNKFAIPLSLYYSPLQWPVIMYLFHMLLPLTGLEYCSCINYPLVACNNVTVPSTTTLSVACNNVTVPSTTTLSVACNNVTVPSTTTLSVACNNVTVPSTTTL